MRGGPIDGPSGLPIAPSPHRGPTGSTVLLLHNLIAERLGDGGARRVRNGAAQLERGAERAPVVRQHGEHALVLALPALVRPLSDRTEQGHVIA